MIAIVDYGVGNLFSVKNALQAIDAEAVIAKTKEEILQAEKIILPGVGAFGDCMKNLQATGFIPVLEEKVFQKNCPLLGICVGLQILFEDSEESPGAKGLGWLKGHVRKIQTTEKIPHMGWNELVFDKNEKLFAGLNRPFVYFVHSFHAKPTGDDKTSVIATSHYGEELTAAVHKKNIFATQFHPEKSGDVGLKILKNFLSLENF